MHQELEHYEQSSFNILPSIESANADMRARDQLALAFSHLGPVFAGHNMCERCEVLVRKEQLHGYRLLPMAQGDRREGQVGYEQHSGHTRYKP